MKRKDSNNVLKLLPAPKYPQNSFISGKLDLVFHKLSDCALCSRTQYQCQICWSGGETWATVKTTVHGGFLQGE